MVLLLLLLLFGMIWVCFAAAACCPYAGDQHLANSANRKTLSALHRLHMADCMTHLLPPCCHLNIVQAAATAPTGPYYMSGGMPPTPAAAAVAAAATGGMLSPRATLDRRGSAFLDAPGTANRAAGSGWGQWAPTGAAGEAGWSGGGGGAAAAAAGGTAADKRGAGLGQELITPLQVDPSIDFDQVRWFVHSGWGSLAAPCVVVWLTKSAQQALAAN